MEAENDGRMGEKMTDGERRKKLVTDLRGYEGYDRRLNTMVHQAANEIERLVQELSHREIDIETWKAEHEATLAQSKDAIEGLLSEWDKFCKYGSPMAKSANEPVTYARKVLSDLRARAADRSGK